MVQRGRSRTRLLEQQQITGSICDMNRQQQQAAAAAATPTALAAQLPNTSFETI
jgi:hypothetical protein